MHYFDWTATTPPTERVIEKVNKTLTEEWGNPSSVHRFGGSAAKLLEEARRDVLRGIGFGREAAGRLIFTSGGTEANNLAILGSAYAKARRGAILITEGEHASVEMCARALEADGFQVIRIPTAGGQINIDAIRSAEGEILAASFMLVNNETGAVYDVYSAARAVREKSPAAFIHADAVQGFMKLRFTPEKLGVNAISVSAHKIGGLKGAGALYIDNASVSAKRISPRMLGGGQEGALRSGTENMPGICAFGEAVREALETFDLRKKRVEKLRTLLEEKLEGSGLIINQPPQGSSLPEILSVTVPGVKSETVLNFLSQNDFCISAGSACSSHGHGTSSALRGFGLSDKDADSTVRISLSHLNTPEETEKLADLLASSAKLRGLKNYR